MSNSILLMHTLFGTGLKSGAHLEDVMEGFYELCCQQLLATIVPALHNNGGDRPSRPPAVRRVDLYALSRLPESTAPHGQQ